MKKLEKKYTPTLDNNGQSCFVRSDFLKMKCVCKTQMMPLPDHQNPVDEELGTGTHILPKFKIMIASTRLRWLR
jgi:hypothetical protein